MELSLVAAAVLILMDGIKKVFPAVLHSGLKTFKKSTATSLLKKCYIFSKSLDHFEGEKCAL